MTSSRQSWAAWLCIVSAVVPFSTNADDLLVAQWGHSLAGANMAVALEQGLFAKAGSSVTGIVAAQGGGAGVRTVLAADNKVTLGYAVTSLTAAVAAIEKGEDLRIVNEGAR